MSAAHASQLMDYLKARAEGMGTPPTSDAICRALGCSPAEAVRAVQTLVKFGRIRIREMADGVRGLHVHVDLIDEGIMLTPLGPERMDDAERFMAEQIAAAMVAADRRGDGEDEAAAAAVAAE